MTKLVKKHLKGFNLSFREFKIMKMNFVVNKGYKKSNEDELLNPDIGGGGKFDKDSNLLGVSLHVSLANKGVPYSFSLETVAFFELTGSLEEEQIERIARVNCSAMMFPYLRETIADMTRRAGFPPLHMPPVNFVALYEETKAVKLKKAVSKKTTSAKVKPKKAVCKKTTSIKAKPKKLVVRKARKVTK
jgi:preprotein translocase subunit SecB